MFVWTELKLLNWFNTYRIHILVDNMAGPKIWLAIRVDKKQLCMNGPVICLADWSFEFRAFTSAQEITPHSAEVIHHPFQQPSWDIVRGLLSTSLNSINFKGKLVRHFVRFLHLNNRLDNRMNCDVAELPIQQPKENQKIGQETPKEIDLNFPCGLDFLPASSNIVFYCPFQVGLDRLDFILRLLLLAWDGTLLNTYWLEIICLNVFSRIFVDCLGFHEMNLNFEFLWKQMRKKRPYLYTHVVETKYI